MLKQIISVATREPFTLVVKFSTGERKEIVLDTLIAKNPIFSVFQGNETYFNHVMIAKGGYGLYWDDNLDVASDFLYEKGSLMNPMEDSLEYVKNEKAIYEIVINSDIKNKAEELMQIMGLDFNTAVTLFIYQVYYTKSIPFPIKLPDWMKN